MKSTRARAYAENVLQHKRSEEQVAGTRPGPFETATGSSIHVMEDGGARFFPGASGHFELTADEAEAATIWFKGNFGG